jgi:hypothetical protein
MLREQSGEMSRAYTHSRGEHLDGRAFAVECAVIGYQTCRAFRVGAAAAPRWTEGSGFGTAAKTGAKSGRFGGGSAREETNIARVCGSNRADRPAIDAGRSDTGKEAPVIGRVAGHPRSLAFRITSTPTSVGCIIHPTGRSPIPASAPGTESESGEHGARPHASSVVPNAQWLIHKPSTTRGATHGGSARATVLLSFGLMAKLAALMTFAATLNEIAADWSLNASQSGWIGGVYFAGYALGVPFLAGASDRMDGRWLYLGSALLGAAASFAFALFADGFVVALVLRFLGGIGLAGVHMPGLNLLMNRIDRSFQGRAAGIYTSSYAAGSAGSFLTAGVVDAVFGWRAAFVATGIGPLLSICALALLPAGSTRRRCNKGHRRPGRFCAITP